MLNKSLPKTAFKHYQDMLNVNFPEQTATPDDNPVRGLNF